MKRLPLQILAIGVLIGFGCLAISASPKVTQSVFQNGAGIWVGEADRTVAIFYDKNSGPVIGMYGAPLHDEKMAEISACDFAIALNKDRTPVMQIRLKDGKIGFVDLQDVYNLVNKPKLPPAPEPCCGKVTKQCSCSDGGPCTCGANCQCDLAKKIKDETKRMADRLEVLKERKDGLYNFKFDEWAYINDNEVLIDGKFYKIGEDRPPTPRPER